MAPERFGLLQALLAYLLAACGEEAQAVIPAAELVDRFMIPAEALEEHLALLNLVNFGGGCYAVYAELRGDKVHVDKELFGDTFRSPPRLTPLEARAIRLALEFVGPMIAAEAHRPLDKVRRKLEETFGQFDLVQTAEPPADRVEERLIRALSEGIKRRRLVDIEYVKVGEEAVVAHTVEPYWLERQLPHWYVHTWDRTRGDVRSFRLDRMRSATMASEKFEPREGFEPDRLRDARVARIHYSKAGRPLGGRTRRPAAARRERHGRPEGRRHGVARRGDPSLPRRGCRARAAGSSAERRPPRARAPVRARSRASPRQGLRAS